jgi:hypothetical protein
MSAVMRMTVLPAAFVSVLVVVDCRLDHLLLATACGATPPRFDVDAFLNSPDKGTPCTSTHGQAKSRSLTEK